MSYPSKKELEAECKLEGRISIFYRNPGSKDIAQALAAEIGGVEISQAYSTQTIKKNKAIRPINSSWWTFVESFSELFAEKAVLETATWWQACPAKRPERRPKGGLKKIKASGKKSNSQP